MSCRRGLQHWNGGKCHDIKCHCARINTNPKMFEFDEGKIAKTGAKAETIKRKKSEKEKDIVQRLPILDKKSQEESIK